MPLDEYRFHTLPPLASSRPAKKFSWLAAAGNDTPRRPLTASIEEESTMRARIMRAAARPTNKAPAGNFTGLVLHEEVFAPEAPSRLRASRVCFTPGGRTNWHTHAVGQVLYVLSGVGRYQTQGEVVQMLLPGDTVVIPPGVKHWHGAAPDHMMAHLAMSESNEKGEATTWLEPVSDADYAKAPAKAE
jgi:quercetin dioxygenase-like cupin family protein